MPRLQFVSWLLLLDFVSGQIPTPPSIPSIPAIATINENAGLAIASSATVAANSIASVATQNIAPSATSQALAVASSATVKANSIASSATVSADSLASSATVSADSLVATASRTDSPTATSSPTAALSSSSSASSAAAAATESAASSAAASKALSSSSKVGIGLGVPLGAAMAFAVGGFLIFRHRNYKRDSRRGHSGNIKGGAYDPGSDEENRETTIGAWDQRTSDSLQDFRTGGVSREGTVSHSPNSQGVSPQSATESRGAGWGGRGIIAPAVPEVHGEHVPPFTTELKGSSGVWKAELPS